LNVDGGTIAPGNTATPYGTLTVAGDANFGAAGTLHLVSNPLSTASALLAVTGDANLAGSLEVDFGGRAPEIGSIYTLLSATSITGTFGQLTLPPSVNGTLIYSATSVELQITANATDEIFADGFDGN